MQLYIHFGIYKAGSSYLQYILANSRSYLEQQNIYFPNSIEDSKMELGVISKGNADGLEKALREKNIDHCTKLLSKWKLAAQTKNCNIVLISAESLVHQLAIEDSLKVLESGAKASNYEKIYAMGFFRDLVDHAISTYKHRAKTGKIPNYKNWIEEVYETPKLLENLAAVRRRSPYINWTFRKFVKDSDVLKQAFFKDWLQINIPEFSGRSSVNESVTLSEVFVMNEVKKYYPLVTDYFVHVLKSLPKEEKASDKTLEASIHTIFYKHLSKDQKGVAQLNLFLPSKEQLVVGAMGSEKINSTILDQVTLSTKQLRMIMEKIKFFATPLGKWILFKRNIAYWLSKLGLKGFLKYRFLI